MTLPSGPFETTCGNCGAIVTVQGLMSTNACGSPDLDTRPPPGERFTMAYWLQQCPHCGYCAGDIAKADMNVKDVVGSQHYQQQFRNLSYPDLANSFLCKALLDENRDMIVAAAWAALHAAWVCDDGSLPDRAAQCRRKALDLIGVLHSQGEQLAAQEGADSAIEIDLLRRCREFDRARRLIRNKMEKTEDENVRIILKYQEHLAVSKDSDCYTMEKAFEWKG